MPFQWLFHTIGLSTLMLETFLKISQTSSIWPLHIPYLWPGDPKSSTSSSQPWCAAWPLLGFSKPSTSIVASICRLFCSLCRAAPGSTQAVADLAPSRRPQSQCTWWTASDHSGLQPYPLHEQHTLEAKLVSTKAPMKQVPLRRDGSCTAAPLLKSQPVLAASWPGVNPSN